MLLPGTADTSWLLCLWTLLVASCKALAGCPRACFCNTISHIVYCSRRGLPYIPEGIPRDSLQLNLNGNVFRTSLLQRANFSNLLNLEHLYLSECGIETIEVESFVDLVNLQWLDLSNNRIRVIQEHTFRGLHLMHLFLNGNRNVQILDNSFEELETTGLYLHDCSLRKLSPDVLSPLNKTLRYLWLNGNEMERLDKRFLPIFQTLSHLRLGSNPLHCNCEIFWLKEFYDNHEDVFKGALPPSCLTPQKARGKYFNSLSQYDFTCMPPVFNNIDAIFDDSLGRLRCTASGDPAPTLFWIQPTGTSSKYAPPQDEDAKQNEGTLVIAGGPESGGADLSGMYICLAYNEAGNVTLTLNVSWPRSKSTTMPEGDEEEDVLATSPATSPATRSKHKHHHHVTTAQPPTKKTKKQVVNNHNNSHNKNYNFTALNMLDFKRRQGQRLFNLTELVGAVIGTHVCTLLLCLIFMPIYLKRQWKRRSPHQGLEKNPNETLYLNGIGAVDYLDTPSPKR